MLNYYFAENLKTKHLFVKKMSVYGPLFAVLLIFILSSDFLFIHLFNWWYTIIIPILMSFSCALLSRVDGQMEDRAIKGFPLEYKKVWIAKVIIGSKYLLLSGLFLLVSYLLLKVIFRDERIFEISASNAIPAIIILLIIYLWQIPLYLYLGYKIGIFFTIFVSILFNTVIGPILAVKSYWFLCPFSYSSRVLCPVLKIMPNGLPLSEENLTSFPELGSYHVIITGMILSIVLLIGLVMLTVKWYQKKEVR